MKNFISLPGNKFGRLLVVKYHETINGRPYYECKCDCGNTCIKNGKYLSNGDTRSCGCLKIDTANQNSLKGSTHKLTKHPIYKVWGSMKDRCLNPRCHAYPHYGGRGIGISPEWMQFQNFYDDVIEGYKNGLELDRFPDNGGDYSKNNFRWATATENLRNRRNSVYLTVEGEMKHIAEWEKETGISRHSIWHRIFHEGKSGKEALFGVRNLKKQNI